MIELIDTDDVMNVLTLWKGLGPSEDTLESLGTVYEDVPEPLLKLLERKNTPVDPADKYGRALGL